MLGLLCVFFILNIASGQVNIPFTTVLKTLFGDCSNTTWQIIIWEYRLPKAITALFTGMAISISGLLMQTLFRNPMAGPYVLGLTSGSSLGVAILIMGSSFLPSFFVSQMSTALASIIGSLLVLLAVFLVSNRLKDTMSILVVGLMFSSFTAAIINVLTYFSTAEALQRFTFWSLGNLSNLSNDMLWLLFIFTLIGLMLAFFSCKSLDTLLLGENYAKSLGLNVKKSRVIIILATSILTGAVTAFVGPIAFIGLAVPHIAKLTFQTNKHKVLFFATLLYGGITLLFCDLIAQLPFLEVVLPINAVTSLIGAPVVIYLLIRKQKII